MKAFLISIAVFFISISIAAQTIQNGFFDFSYAEDEGKIYLLIDDEDLDKQFLYVNALSAGLGSNDIGLDRGQLGSERIVSFKKAGEKLLMVQPNLDYRAISDNELERKSVEEAFAKSVLWGFKIGDKEGNRYKIDLTDFLMRDAHGVSQRLKRSKQGSFKLDKSRSAVWMDRTKTFPDNTEFDVLLTFTGHAEGRYVRSVTPSADAITLHQHHSFVRLPDDNYQPRKFHPYAGYFPMSFYDYAVAIEDDIEQRYIYRHRLAKKDPSAQVSEPVEPIIYYMDPGCPDPVKSALMAGAAWWDQAFQSIGYAPGTFQIKELPEGADMLDVRYNVIQWVHRSTRGWSYGASVSDPRTGEIIKGHVSLGSLRVRQDFLIAQGLLSPYAEDDDNHDPMLALALSRLKQLAAHEVGHTIGLAHNFAASYNDRASVMDYPHPYVTMDDAGRISFDQAYDDKIGDWDKFTIGYGYQDFADDIDEDEALNEMINQAQLDGFLFISDSDARPAGGAHPNAHLWDNGADPVEELNRLMGIRAKALSQLGENSITEGTPMSELEKVLVPIYLLHRYQVDAVSKLIGGLNYQYHVKGDVMNHKVTPVDYKIQNRAVESLLNTLSSQHLRLPSNLLRLIPPPAYGYPRSRETFNSKTNLAFDPLSVAESHIHMTLQFMLHPDRLARIHRHGATGMSVVELEPFLDQIVEHLFAMKSEDSYDQELNQLVQKILVTHLLQLSSDSSVDINVAAVAHHALHKVGDNYLKNSSIAHNYYLMELINQSKIHGDDFSLPKISNMPPGSPIGCGMMDHLKP